jgi:putative transposase
VVAGAEFRARLINSARSRRGPPSYWVVYRIVRGLPADLLTLAHQGTKAYSDAFDLVHRREASGPNAIWQADHSPLDISLVCPGGEPEKPWLTIVMDDYSRAVAGCLLSFEPPSPLHTSFALSRTAYGSPRSPLRSCMLRRP